MSKKLLSLVLVWLLASGALLPLGAEAQGRGGRGALAVPVVGTVNEAAVTGTFFIQNFVRSATSPIGVGAAGTFVGSDGTVVQAVMDVASLASRGGAGPSIQQVACGILDLTLGPLDLDLLGLTIHLDEVVLNIAAEPGPGNLLGNLLCAIAGLLDPPGPLGQLLAFLNQLLGILA
jgi:hypothetical protein